MKHSLDFRVDPIPGLEFFDDIHAYRFIGEWVPYSMTQVCKGHDSYFDDTLAKPDNDPERLRLLEAIQRGSDIHQLLEDWARGYEPDPGIYADWFNPCVSDEFWSRWRPVNGGIELSLYDPRYKIAGKCDLIIQNQSTGELALADYKTQKSRSSRPYNIRPQLGGYCNLADSNPFTRHLQIERCFAIWVRPGNTTFQPLDGADCIIEYLAARDLFFHSLPDF